ncbi:MAG: TOBE domain-containing protein [Halobacteriaceae archaeon]
MPTTRRGDPDVRTRIHAGDVTFDADDAALLRAVAADGSLNAAATTLGRSYSRAHARLQTLESAFGDLLERRRGGADGGGSDLTPAAETLLARFDRLHAALTGHADAEETVFVGEVTDRTGDLATVRTDAGPLRAIVPGDATRVAVGVRADAVTLHAPAAAPESDATSARNRFRGTVQAVDAGRGVALVDVDVGATGDLAALVTQTSVDSLGLEPGRAVAASFKATASWGTHRTPRDP